MQVINEKNSQFNRYMPLQKSKPFKSKPIKLKTHIVFKGDPAFHEESFDIKPLNRRKRIFQEDQANILPAQLLHNQSEYNSKVQVQQQIHENIIQNFDQQIGHFPNNFYRNKTRNITKRLTSQQEQLYFEPNNLESDINFGIMPQNTSQNNPAINLSKASQTTQKKGQIYLKNPNQTKQAQVIVTTISSAAQPTGQVVNFSYQGQNFQNQNNEVIQSRVKKVTTLINKSPQNSNSTTIFVNEGGILGPKKNKKIEMHGSDYFDFDVNNNENIDKNESIINELRMTDTPQFHMRNGKSSDIINNFISQDYENVNSQKNIEKYKKSMSDGNKLLIEGRNFPSKINNVNSSIVSYKSVQKTFDHQNLKNQQAQNALNFDEIKSIPEQIITKSQNESQQVLFNQLFQNHLQDNSKRNKNSLEDSVSFQQDGGASLFDKILKQRQNIFNKNKQPEIELRRRISDKRDSLIKINGSNINFNQNNSVFKPNDFITDSKQVPAGLKKSINISYIPKKSQQQKKQLSSSKLQSSSPILQSHVKRIEMNVQNNESKNKSKFVSSKNQQISAMKNSAVKNRNLKNKNQLNRKSNQSIPESVGNEDDENSIGSQYSDQDDFIEEQKSASQQQSSLEQKKAKFDKSIKKSSKHLKKKIESEVQLQDYLKSQQQKIQLRQIEKIMENVPQIKNNLKKKSNKNKNPIVKIPKKQQTKITEFPLGQQPVVYTAPNQLNPLQRQLLETVGIKLIEDSLNNNPAQNSTVQFYNQMGFNHNNVPNIQLNKENWGQTQDNNSNMQLEKNNSPPERDMQKQFQENLPFFFDHHRKILQKQNSDQKGVNLTDKNPNLMGVPFDQYKQNLRSYDNQFQQITKVLYNQLNKLISSNLSQHNQIPNQNNFTFKNQQRQSEEISSPFSFKKHKLAQQMQPNIKVSKPKMSFQNDNQISRENLFDQQKRGDFFSNQKREQGLYSKQIYDELKRFNTRNKMTQNSREKDKAFYEESQNDESQYYSFYNDDQEPRYKYSTFNKTDSYYPVGRQTRYRKVPSEKSLRSKYELKPSSDLGLLYQKIEQLTKQIHQQLPQIRKQIEENQHQIRKIETNLLIKNTAEQHALIKILQKMKLKDLQLQQKQIETKNKDHQLSFYQNQLASLKTQFLTNNNQTIQNFQMQNYFQNRLHKIQSYNENLFQKLSSKKASYSSFIIPEKQPFKKYRENQALLQRQSKIIPQRYSTIIPQKTTIPHKQKHFI